MIKLLLSGKQLLLFIIIAWSLLAFVGYNVLTVDASTSKEKYHYDSYEEYNEIVEPICKDHDGKIDYGSGECMFKNDSREKAIIFEKELDDRGLGGDYTAEEEASWNQKAEAEIAVKEDAICDDEDADTTDIKLCMSGSREQQFEHNYDKESCEQVNGDWNKKKGSGCTFYEDEQQDILDTAEEQRKIIDKEEQKALAAIDEYNALQAQAQQEEEIEDWSNTVSDEEQEKINFEAQKQQVKYEQLADSSPIDYEKVIEEAIDKEDEPEQQEEEIAEYNEEDDNQVNTDTEDSSDNTDSLDSQDSSDSEDNSSDDGGDSSDSSDDSSSSDDGGDSGDSSESEE